MKSVFFTLVFCVVGTFANGQDKYTDELRSSYKGIFYNLADPNISPGAVIASPSRHNPNYFYHWVRDAGLTMMEMVELYQLPLLPERKAFIEKHIKNWIEFEIRNQNVALSRSNLGEPIFTVNGEIFPQPWGRPQGDGPAIRALAMTKYALALLREGRIAEVNKLYRPELPSVTPIKRDLEYVAHQWQEQSYDLWEEVKGAHFFTRMAQRASLLLGAQLADRLNDPKAAAFYFDRAKDIERALLAHRNDQLGHIVPTVNQTDGWQHKKSQLDVSVILAALYFSMNDGFMDVDDPWILATARKLETTFAGLYKINQDVKLAPAIGRYPEDVYTGNGFGEGNPWFLATNAFGEFYCRLALKSASSLDSSSLKERAVSFLTRTIYHADPGGRMPEQFNRYNGFTQGARDLTWSYTSYVRSFRYCTTDTHFMDHRELEPTQNPSW